MAPKAVAAALHPSPPRPRECTACGDAFTIKQDDPDLIKPCSVCLSDYCHDCLETLFRTAAYEPGAMLPRCCALIQIHTIIARLDKVTAEAYRAKLAELVVPDKVYCPAPACSAFILEKHMPAQQPLRTGTSLKGIFNQILDMVSLCTAARFFRDSTLQESLPDYHKKVPDHIDLDTIRNRVNADKYETADDFMNAIRIIVTSARAYNGPKHSVTSAAKQLEAVARTELSKCVDELVRIVNEVSDRQPLFACPTCHIAICSQCRAVAHDGQCNFSARDHEAAMLINFGYKRCPRCNHGVKKMYGCPHMQCICGAHWCYYCEKSIDQCAGGCAENSDADEESDSDESDVDSPLSGQGLTSSSHTLGATTPERTSTVSGTGVLGRGVVGNQVPGAAAGPLNAAPSTAMAQQPVSQPNTSTQRPSNSQLGDISQLTVNLDGGGSEKWAAAALDFGDEPEEEPGAQIWSCTHGFADFKPREVGFYHGDYDKMECNRCFAHVVFRKAEKGPAAKRRKVSEKLADGRDAERSAEDGSDKVALQCLRCYLVVCEACKAKFHAEAAKEGV